MNVFIFPGFRYLTYFMFARVFACWLVDCVACSSICFEFVRKDANVCFRKVCGEFLWRLVNQTYFSFESHVFVLLSSHESIFCVRSKQTMCQCFVVIFFRVSASKSFHFPEQNGIFNAFNSADSISFLFLIN